MRRVWPSPPPGWVVGAPELTDPECMNSSLSTSTSPRTLRLRALAAICGVLGLAAFAASPAGAAPNVDGKFAVSGVGTNNEITKGPDGNLWVCLLYTSPSPRDGLLSRMPSSA